MKKTNKLLLFLSLILATALISLLMGGVISSIATSSGAVKLDLATIIKNSFNPTSIKIALIFFIIFVVITVVIAIKYQFFNFSRLVNRVDRAKSNLYGSSEFMTQKEMTEKLGTTDAHNSKKFEDYNFSTLKNSDFNGYLVNSYKKNGQLFAQKVDKKHGLVIGTNGSGKSLYFLMPTIQANAKTSSDYQPTLIINDLKGELYQHNSKLLQDNGYNVFVLNLRDPRKGSRFNPLDLIWDLYHEYLKTQEESLIDKVSAYIYEITVALCPNGQGEQAHWTQGAQGLIAGCIWAMLEDSEIPEYEMTKDKFTFQQISNFLNRYSDDLDNFLLKRKFDSRVHDLCSMITKNDSEKTRAGYLSTAQVSLRVFQEEGIRYITGRSDFKLEDIMKKPTAFFLIIPDENQARYVLANTMIVQLYNFLTYQASIKENLSLDRTVYFLLDEFGNMPKIEQFPQWISTSRGRNIFFCVILQALSQLDSTYGQDNAKTILQNCHFQMFLGATEDSTLDYFITQLGTYTVYNRSANINSAKGSLDDFDGTVGLTEKKLVNKDQLQRISAGECYFTLSREKPCHGHLIPIFDSELNTNKTFLRQGLPLPTNIEKYRFIEHAYDIKDRNRIFDIGKEEEIKNKENKIETKELIKEDDEEIVDITDEYNKTEKVSAKEEKTSSKEDSTIEKEITVDPTKISKIDSKTIDSLKNLKDLEVNDDSDLNFLKLIKKGVNSNEKEIKYMPYEFDD